MSNFAETAASNADSNTEPTSSPEDKAAIDREYAREQARVDHLYHLLDEKHRNYRAAQTRAMATKGAGTPQSLVERDVMAAHFGQGAATLEQVEDRLVFGRLDRKDEGPIYVGRIGLSDGNEQAMIDWRAAAARPFYQATAANPLGLVRRRHIGLQLREVRSLDDDVFDADAAEKLGGTVHGEGALLAALGRARTGHMTDIVSTIQAEQDRVIRHPAKQILVIQGGPGTGKTAVALHRAAYLLYTQRERLARSGVLIVGPSRTFLRYIEQVLPALGETGVVSTTIGNLLPGIRAVAETDERLVQLKGQMKWVQAARKLVATLVRDPGRDQQFRIGTHNIVLRRDDVVAAQLEILARNEPHHVGWEAFATQMVGNLTRQVMRAEPNGDWAFTSERVRSNPQIRRAINLAWLPSDPVALLAKLWAQPRLLEEVAPFLEPRERELLWRPRTAAVTTADIPLLDELAELLGPTPPRVGEERDEAAAQTVSRLDKEYAAAASNPATPAGTDTPAAGASRQQQRELERAAAAIAAISEESGLVSAAAITERAAAEEQRLTTAEAAQNSRTWTYGHIVVDEAQELTPLAWHALLRRCPSRSFTVVGDLAQRSSLPPAAAWSQALGPAARGLEDVVTLTVCYRTPREIIESAQESALAAGLVGMTELKAARSLPGSLRTTPVAATSLPDDETLAAIQGSGEVPSDALVAAEMQTENAQAWLAATTAALQQIHADLPGGTSSPLGRVALITPLRHRVYTELAHRAAAAVDAHVARHDTLILTADEAKGLEFDGSVVIDPQLLGEQNPASLYVALTRSTQLLQRVENPHTK